MTPESSSGERSAVVTGAKRGLADDLGCTFTVEGTVAVDLSMETSVEVAYATGAMVRAEMWHAVTTAGEARPPRSTSSRRMRASTSTTSIHPLTECEGRIGSNRRSIERFDDSTD